MAASGSRGEAARAWTATSTWAPAGGAAVEDAVSFETSDEDAEESPAGVVLTRPDPGEDGDAPPCEVTVTFRGMYEIHRVYVRSTARIYEIYHSTNTKGTGKDYLCTVRCGLATKEPQSSGEESSASTGEKRENETKSVSSSSSDDSWVDVKIPESPNNTSKSQERNVAGTCQEINMAHYEATAEMTDVSPCVSLTVRLLSLQSKTSVHIEEIYIFGDPVESTHDVSVSEPGNMGGSSLLAMLVPSIMQMSKSRNYKIDDGYFSHGSRSQPTQDYVVKESSPHENISQETRPCVSDDSKSAGTGSSSTDGGTVSNEKSNQAQLLLKDPMSVQLPVEATESTKVSSVRVQLVSNTDELANSSMNGILTPYNHIERKLDTLLSKMEKMELYCSRFEDIMIKPLGSIEARLQRLEQQFDSFSGDIQSLRNSTARVSAPDGSSNTKSQEEVHNDGNAGTPVSITERKSGLFVRAPGFSSDLSDGNEVNVHGASLVPALLVKDPESISQPEFAGGKLHEGPISPVDCAQSCEYKERKTSPGLVIRVPEFPDDDDDDEEVVEEKITEVSDNVSVNGDTLCRNIIDSSKGNNMCRNIDVSKSSIVQKNSVNDDEVDDHTQGDTLCRNNIDGSKGKNRVSVNGALASALEALLMSSKGTSSSRSVVFPASNVSAENTDESSSSSPSGDIDKMSTKDGLDDQTPGSIVNANLDGTFTSCQDIVFPASNVSAENTDESSSSSPSGYIDKMSTKDGLDDQTPGSIVNANLDGTFISCQDIDGTPHTSLSKPVFDSKVERNEKNSHLDWDKEAFVASTVSLGVPLQPHVVDESIDDGSCINEQNNDPKLDAMPFITSTGHLDPSLPFAACESVDNEARVKEIRAAIPLAEFLSARNSHSCKNGTSEVCCSTNGAEILSFERESADADKNLKNISQLLVKKALEADDEDECLPSVPIRPISEGSNCASLSYVVNRNSINRIETASDKDCGLKNTEESARFSVGLNSVCCQSSSAGSPKNMTESNSFDWSVDDIFSKSNVEYSWSDLCSMESFSGVCARQPVVSANTAAEKCVEDLLAGIGASSTVTPVAGEELQNVHDILGVTFTEKSTSKSSPSLEVLLAESSDSEVQISDDDAGIGSAQLFGSFSSDDSASATTEALVDVADLYTESPAYAAALNEPLADVDALPLETFADGSSGDPTSLI